MISFSCLSDAIVKMNDNKTLLMSLNFSVTTRKDMIRRVFTIDQLITTTSSNDRPLPYADYVPYLFPPSMIFLCSPSGHQNIVYCNYDYDASEHPIEEPQIDSVVIKCHRKDKGNGVCFVLFR